jgi:hypothetical protein
MSSKKRPSRPRSADMNSPLRWRRASSASPSRLKQGFASSGRQATSRRPAVTGRIYLRRLSPAPSIGTSESTTGSPAASLCRRSHPGNSAPGERCAEPVRRRGQAGPRRGSRKLAKYLPRRELRDLPGQGRGEAAPIALPASTGRPERPLDRLASHAPPGEKRRAGGAARVEGGEKRVLMLWLILGIVLLVVAIAGGVIIHPVLLLLAILALVMFVTRHRYA